MGLRGSPVYEFVTDTVVPEDALLGNEGEGFTTAMRVLDRGRIEVAAMSLGIGKAALDAAVDWGRAQDQRQSRSTGSRASRSSRGHVHRSTVRPGC